MFLYAMISFVTNLAAPVGKIWGASFDDPAQAERMGMLGNLFNFLAYLIMGIPAGNYLAKYGYKKTALTAIFLGFIGIAVQWMSGVFDSFAVYLGGALLGGFCVCMLNTVVNPMLNLLGGGGNRGNQLNMVGGTLNSLSGALTPMLVGAIIGESLAGKQIDDVNVVLYIAVGFPSPDLRCDCDLLLRRRGGRNPRYVDQLSDAESRFCGCRPDCRSLLDPHAHRPFRRFDDWR